MSLFSSSPKNQYVVTAPTLPPEEEETQQSMPNHVKIIYGKETPDAPNADYSLEKRLTLLDGFLTRMKNALQNIETGSEAERNLKFHQLREFLIPHGFFTAALLAAGCEPHDIITAKSKHFKGFQNPYNLVNTASLSYSAWEYTAGAFAHDNQNYSGLLDTYATAVIDDDQAKATMLDALGYKSREFWEVNIAAPMRNLSGTIDQRAGKATASTVRGMLQSLRDDEYVFKALSPKGRTAIQRTLDHNGQIIICNIYGYQLQEYSFIAYEEYTSYTHRPNHGLLLDLKNGGITEILGDDSFAAWAENNRDNLKQSFNAEDFAGGYNSHFPSASSVLDHLIKGGKTTYPGYYNAIADQSIPVRALFNYTTARSDNYALRHGRLNSTGSDGIASVYQKLIGNNSDWLDQTVVFGKSQQKWKKANDFWQNYFHYIPIVKEFGDLVFNIHNSIYGKTLSDRESGKFGVIISSLTLIHELAPNVAESVLSDIGSSTISSISKRFGWRNNTETNEFEMTRIEQLGQSDILGIRHDFDEENGIYHFGNNMFVNAENGDAFQIALNKETGFLQKVGTGTSENPTGPVVFRYKAPSTSGETKTFWDALRPEEGPDHFPQNYATNLDARALHSLGNEVYRDSNGIEYIKVEYQYFKSKTLVKPDGTSERVIYRNATDDNTNRLVQFRDDKWQVIPSSRGLGKYGIRNLANRMFELSRTPTENMARDVFNRVRSAYSQGLKSGNKSYAMDYDPDFFYQARNQVSNNLIRTLRKMGAVNDKLKIFPTDEDPIKIDAGNCGELSLSAAKEVIKMGGYAEIWAFPEYIDHVFTVVGHPPGTTSVNFADWEGLWIVDTWANVVTEAPQYIQKLSEKMLKWKKDNKVISTFDATIWKNTHGYKRIQISPTDEHWLSNIKTSTKIQFEAPSSANPNPWKYRITTMDRNP